MGKFDLYKIPLINLTEGVHQFEYIIDDQFFMLIGDVDSDLKRGSVKVDLSVKRSSSTFEFNFVLQGQVFVPCNRCLDDMPVEIDTKNRLYVKFGVEYSEESDEIVIIPESEGEINIAWFLYEFIALSIPIKHVHAPGTCNKTMTSKLNRHKAVDSSNLEDSDDGDVEDLDEDIVEEPNDPRWDALKGLVDEE